MRKINFSYTVEWEKIEEFIFERVNHLVSFTDYICLAENIYDCINELVHNPSSRRAIMTLNNSKNMSCLVSVQFLIDGNILYVIASYRSQHINLGRPHDIRLINYLTTLFLENFNNNIQRTLKPLLTFNISDYHD